jgi:hypothetical protein
MGTLSVSILPLNILVLPQVTTQTEKLVTVVTSAVHSHRPHVHPMMVMSELNQHSKGTVGTSALEQIPPEGLLQDQAYKDISR